MNRFENIKNSDVKLSMFAFNTLNNEALPIYLKINLAVSSEQQRQAYDLRKSTKNVLPMSKINSKNGEWTFKNFFAKFFNKLKLNKILFYISNFIDFKKQFQITLFFFIRFSKNFPKI